MAITAHHSPDVGTITTSPTSHEAHLTPVPPEATLLDIAEQQRRANAAVFLGSTAQAQDNYLSALHSEARQPNPLKNCPKQREPQNNAEIGRAYSEYARNSVVFGLVYGTTHMIGSSPAYFEAAHAYLGMNGKPEEIADNAGRAAETAALTGDWLAFCNWSDRAGWAAGKGEDIWNRYREARGTWLAAESLAEAESVDPAEVARQWGLDAFARGFVALNAHKILTERVQNAPSADPQAGLDSIGHNDGTSRDYLPPPF